MVRTAVERTKASMAVVARRAMKVRRVEEGN